MRRSRLCFLICIVFTICTNYAAFAADPGLAITPLTVDFPSIYLRCKITSSEARDLGTGSFKILEDGAAIQDFSLSRSKARQFMTLLLDRSSSLEQVIGDVRRSAQEFVTALPPEVKLSVISFASDVDINQDFTLDKEQLTKAISSIRSWGGTVLYDAACLAIEQLYYNSDPRDLRTLVLFTDGRDETPVGRRRMSTANLEDVLKNAVKQNIRILAVGLGSEIDEEVLKNLARTTQGWYIHAPTSKELYGIYQKIAQRVKMEKHFGLSYIAPESRRDGRKHHVRVELTLNGETRISEASYDAALDPMILRQGIPLPPPVTVPVRKPPQGLDISQPVIKPFATPSVQIASGPVPDKLPVSATPPEIPPAAKSSIELASPTKVFVIPKIRDSSLREFSDNPSNSGDSPANNQTK